MLSRLPEGWGEGACFKGENGPWKPYAEAADRVLVKWHIKKDKYPKRMFCGTMRIRKTKKS